MKYCNCLAHFFSVFQKKHFPFPNIFFLFLCPILLSSTKKSISRMLHVVTTGAYYPVVTTWKIFTTGASYLTTGTLCNVILQSFGHTPPLNTVIIWRFTSPHSRLRNFSWTCHWLLNSASSEHCRAVVDTCDLSDAWLEGWGNMV